jgi:membrane associated rhomboid family serine protease
MTETLPSPEEDPREKTALLLEEGLDRPWMTVGLVLIIVLIHLWIGGIIWSRGNTEWWGIVMENRGQRPRLLARCGAMSGVDLDRGELWRLVSSAFLHANALHLLLNGLALLALGRLCEAIHGHRRLLWLFICCSIVGACFSWMAGNSLSVGASSGIFGLMGAAIVFGWRFRDHLPEDIGTFFRKRLLPWLILNIVIGLVVPMVDNFGHIGGLVAGVILGAILGNRVVPGQDGSSLSRFSLLTGSLLALCLGVVGLSSQW